MTLPDSTATTFTPNDPVWEAEDGRCENQGCGRPMAAAAAVVRLTRLLCPLCADRLGEPFAQGLRLSEPVPKNAPIQGAALAELAAALAVYGVVVRYSPVGNRAMFWLPGVGRFLLRFPRGRPAVLLAARLYPKPKLRIRPQARTRGLPPVRLGAVE